MKARFRKLQTAVDALSDTEKLVFIFAALSVLAAIGGFIQTATAHPDLCLIPAVALGIPAAFVLAHDLRGVFRDGYLALYTTAGASLALGAALWLLTIAT